MNDNKSENAIMKSIFYIVLGALIAFVFTSSFYIQKIKAISEIDEDVYTEPFEKLAKVKSVIDKTFLYEYDQKKLEEGAINGMLEALNDPYTTYLNKDDWEQFNIETEGEYEGVGLYITYNTDKKLVQVITPIEASPAAEAGILSGDFVEEVDGKNVYGVDLSEVADMLKGKIGTMVKIKFLRYEDDDKVTEYEKEIERRKIDLEAVTAKVIEGNIGYIKLPSFDETSYDKFYNSYNDLIKNKKVKGLIIDLRNNPGGLLNVASSITDLLVPKGKIYYTIDKSGNEDHAMSNATKVEVPMAVLINNGSASASEIMAGAIKDYGVGKIIGENSYGKGVVQTVKSLKDGSYLKVTMAEYFSPNGQKINEIGVPPDIEVSLPEDVENIYKVEPEKDTQLKAAIKYIKEEI